MNETRQPRLTLMGTVTAPWRAVLAVALTLVALLATPNGAGAHAFLRDSDPAANAVLPTAPAELTLRFTEPLEQSYSRADLYDGAGTILDGAAFRFGPDGYTVVLVTPPSGLANGTYSVLWRTLSTADGHTAQGYVPFTVGTDRDVTTVVAPAAPAVSTGAPEIVRAASRWLALLGLAAVVAIWPVWLFVLRPAIGPAWQAGPAMARRARRFAVWAIALAVVANLVALGVQALAILAAGGFLGALRTTLFETRYGTLWLVRVGLLLLFSAALLGVAWWWPKRRPFAAATALVLAALLPLPFSLLAHAVAQPEGQVTAVAADMAHLLSAALWVGGIFVVIATLAPGLNDLTAAGRQVVLGRALPRFSALALVAWGVMALTGLYAAALQVGNLTGLTGTPYGQTLLLKLALLVPLLGLAAFNLLVVTRKIRQATDEEAAVGWSGNFVTAVAAEAVLVTLLLGVVGMLIGQMPARDALVAQSGRLIIPLEANGQEGSLTITPGSIGPNHYRLDLGSGHEAHLRNPIGAEAVLRFDLPAQRTGQSEIALAPVAGGAFEGHGSQLSIAGEWTIETKVTGPAQPEWDVRITQPVGLEPPAADLPPPPPRFGTAGIAGLLLLILGLVGIVWAVCARQSAMRREAAGLGIAALAVGAVILLGARLPPPEAAPAVAAALPRPDAAAVARGEPLFASNCVTCHGVGGKGDGPQSGVNGLAPTNLTVGHALAHSDEDIAYWIRNGIPGTGMPGFGGSLSEAEVADIVAYVRDLQVDAQLAAEAPAAEACLAEPRTLAELRPAATPGANLAAEPPPLPLPPAEGVTAGEADLAAIRAVARELVACSNAGDTMRRLALYSDDRVRKAYPEGPTTALERIAGTAVPVPAGDRVALLDVTEARRLPDGRLAARVTIDNPQLHTHGPATPGANLQQEAALLVFVEEAGRWRIDEVHQ